MDEDVKKRRFVEHAAIEVSKGMMIWGQNRSFNDEKAARYAAEHALRLWDAINDVLEEK